LVGDGNERIRSSGFVASLGFLGWIYTGGTSHADVFMPFNVNATFVDGYVATGSFDLDLTSLTGSFPMATNVSIHTSAGTVFPALTFSALSSAGSTYAATPQPNWSDLYLRALPTTTCCAWMIGAT
jgi:hypothetical protein